MTNSTAPLEIETREAGAAAASRWTLLSNHGIVLLAVARDPDVRIHQLAVTAGITERACQKILNDLCGAGYVSRRRVGRRNVYSVDPSLPMRHPAMRDTRVAALLQLWGLAPQEGAPPQC